MEAQLHDIYDIIYTPVWKNPWFIFGAVAIGSTLFMVMLWWFFSKKKKQNPLTPQERFERKFKTIKKNAYMVPESVLYAQVTTFVKNYLDTFYSTKCGAKTDEECIVYLKDNTTIPAELKECIMCLLRNATYNKFAKNAVHKETVNELLEALESIVSLP